jgi:hypothetical protein
MWEQYVASKRLLYENTRRITPKTGIFIVIAITLSKLKLLGVLCGVKRAV